MTIFITALIGVLVGFSSGLFGIGGSMFATPLLRMFAGLAPLLALASPMPAILPSSISGSVIYNRNNLIEWRVARISILCGAPLVVAGAWVTQFVSGTALMILTGVFLLYVGVTFLIRGWLLRERPDESTIQHTGRIITISLFAGFLAGFLAIGGGIVFVPAYVRVLRMPVKRALATSLLCVGAFAIPGTIMHAALGHIDWLTVLILTITVIPLSNLGARAAVKLRSRTIERIYGIVVLAFAVWFIFAQW
jgi:uncharacterized membrane protein YfcA